jgi:hypothetical protein
VAGGLLAVAVLVVIGALLGPSRAPQATPIAQATVTLGATASPPPTTAPTASASPLPATPTAEPTASPTVAPIPTAEPTAAPTPTLEPTPDPTPEPTSQFTEFFDGIWEIGVDLEPGTYRTTDYTDSCYWARLKGFSGELGDIITNNFSSGYQVVTIPARDVGFESDGCGDWTSDLSQVTETKTTFDEGTYIVGTDIQPGTYRSSEGDGCYWARLSGFRGTIGDIITNDFRSGGVATVTIRQSDEGFSSNGCGTWTLR